MREFGREDRVGAEMRRELSQMIRDEIKDPRLGMVTVQEVRVTRDLSHAKVFFTVMDKDQAKQSGKVLARAAGFLRRRLGDELTLRTIPELHFVYDTSLEEGIRLSSLIDQAMASNKPEGD